MLNDILMKQARRLAPTARSDTTNTDYFRLKALGIDPDTPTVPQTPKSIRARTAGNGRPKSGRSSFQDSTPTQGPVSSKQILPSLFDGAIAQGTATSRENGGEEDGLFAQIDAIRKALAESEQWFQDERQSIERSLKFKQPRVSPHRPTTITESLAQRRLREVKERGSTPSRTELRLRAMGERALLPKGFWDGEGMGLSLMDSKGKEVHKRSSSISPKSFESQ